ncbi:MAG TPA: translation elongation factor Ts [Thermoanaerobaculia bacterium]|nr:translation elongation factor Ts [Thermoanaerobaculia bacterium]
MAQISASQVKELRERTGAGMMDCKAALTEAGGDFEEAVKVLRKKGLAAAGKKAGRIATEGLVHVHVAGSTAVLAEVNCETDFVAKTDDFRTFVSDVAALIASSGVKSVEELMKVKWPDDPENHNVEQVISEKVARMGENVSVRRFASYRAGDHGLIGHYVHGNGRIGVVVELGAGNAVLKPQIENVAREIAMHIAASEPRYVKREEAPASDLDTEKEIARDQALKSGKPEAVVEKIVAGKMEKFYAETALLEQPFVRDDKVTVAQYLLKQQNETDTKLEVRRFARFKLGEGLQKREDNFAAEVMAQAGQ